MHGEWKEFNDFLLLCATSDDSPFKKIAFRLIRSAPSSFSSKNLQTAIQNLMKKSLVDDSLRTEAMKSLNCLIRDVNKDKATDAIIEYLVPTVHKLLIHDDSTVIDASLDCLDNIIAKCPDMLQIHLISILTHTCKRIHTEDRTDGYSSAARFLTSLCEKAPMLIKGYAAEKIPDIVECSLLMAVEADLKEEGIINCSRSIMDPVMEGIGGETINPVLFRIAKTSINNDEWKERYRGLLALITMDMKCEGMDGDSIERMVDMLITSLRDPNARLQNGAICGLGRLSSANLEKFHDTVITSLISTSSNPSSVHQVASRAVFTLSELIRQASKDVISVHFDALIRIAIVGLQTKQKEEDSNEFVSLSLLSSLAKSAPQLITKYYSQLILPVKNLISHKELFYEALSCVSHLGVAVGRETFAADASEVMRVITERILHLLGSFRHRNSADDVYRMISLMGSHAVPFLPSLVPPLNKAAKGDQSEHKCEYDINDEKHAAQSVLTCLVKELRGHFAPFVPVVAGLAIDHFAHVDNDADRQWAAAVFPLLIASAKAQGGVTSIHSMWLDLWNVFNRIIKTEGKNEFSKAVADCIIQLVQGGNEPEKKHIEEVLKEKK